MLVGFSELTQAQL